MRFAPIVILGLYIYFEVSFFVLVANYIGVFFALFGIVVTSLAGLSLVKSQGMKNFITMQEKMANNEDPSREIIKSTSLFLSGFFLLIPGFLTDILAIMLLLPPVQHIFARFFVPKAHYATRFTRHGFYRQTNNNEDNIIEGQFKRRDDE